MLEAVAPGQVQVVVDPELDHRAAGAEPRRKSRGEREGQAADHRAPAPSLTANSVSTPESSKKKIARSK